MNYQEALEYIHGTHKFGMKLGLHNISLLLGLMGNPHEKLKYVHIAGTNGKGSTAAFISSVLIEAGYRVGIYTSPYIQRFTERIRINSIEISQEDLARITGFVKGKIVEMLEMGETHPTEFEIVTAIAFQYYYENDCDIVVLEVGLGGRYDSTNVIDVPLVSVITTISYDHTDILGKTLPEIAYEKAGIIKKDGDVVAYPHHEEVERVFHDACESQNAELRKTNFGSLHITEYSIHGQTFNYQEHTGLHISLLGEYQTRNAAVALDVLKLLAQKEYRISEDAVRKGMDSAKWPGRLEVLSSSPVFLIDGAHNLEGAKVLVEMLAHYFPGKSISFIIGVLKDKDYKSIIETVSPVARNFITVTPDSPRALPAEELAIFIKPYCKDVEVSDKIELAVRTALQNAQNDDVICAFGSLHYIGHVREYFSKQH